MEGIVYQNLICTFSRLTRHIVHEAAAENDDLVSIRDAGVPVASLYAISGAEVEVLPRGLVGTRHQPGNFTVALVVLSTN